MTARPKVALFAACYNDVMWPETPKAVVRLLRRLGCEVEFPREQTCCGQMFTNTGYANDAKGLVRGFVDTFDAFDYVVAPSGSCTGSVREQHEMIAERVGDQGLAREVLTMFAVPSGLAVPVRQSRPCGFMDHRVEGHGVGVRVVGVRRFGCCGLRTVGCGGVHCGVLDRSAISPSVSSRPVRASVSVSPL